MLVTVQERSCKMEACNIVRVVGATPPSCGSDGKDGEEIIPRPTLMMSEVVWGRLFPGIAGGILDEQVCMLALFE